MLTMSAPLKSSKECKKRIMYYYTTNGLYTLHLKKIITAILILFNSDVEVDVNVDVASIRRKETEKENNQYVTYYMVIGRSEHGYNRNIVVLEKIVG